MNAKELIAAIAEYAAKQFEELYKQLLIEKFKTIPNFNTMEKNNKDLSIGEVGTIHGKTVLCVKCLFPK